MNTTNLTNLTNTTELLTEDALIAKVEVVAFDHIPESKDVIVRLKNGRVIQISPDFNAINLWETEQDFADFLIGHQTLVSLDMGGDACGAFEGTGVTLTLPEPV